MGIRKQRFLKALRHTALPLLYPSSVIRASGRKRVRKVTIPDDDLHPIVRRVRMSDGSMQERAFIVRTRHQPVVELLKGRRTKKIGTRPIKDRKRLLWEEWAEAKKALR